jgi:nitrogen regulatory protein PII
MGDDMVFMNADAKMLMTIVCESFLESQLCSFLEKEGIHGFTIWDSRGLGSHGMQTGESDQDRNICVQIVGTDLTIERVAEKVRTHFFDHYRMIIYLTPASVFRSKKFN